MAMSVDVSRDMPGFGGLNIWVWASIKPGTTVAWLRSITAAPGGTFTAASAPTSTIRSPRMMMVCFCRIPPDRLSNN